MSRLAGLIGWPPREAAERASAMLKAVGNGSAARQSRVPPGAVIAADIAQVPGTTLAFAGALFQPDSVDVLLDQYRQGGLEAVLQRVNGDFALAIVDERDSTVHLARDRFGVRPIFYWTLNGRFAFASRIRSLLCLADVPRDVDRTFTGLFAGSHYRTFDNAPERSPFTAIRQLPAAHYLTWKDGRLSMRRYWTLNAEQDWQTDEDELAEQYRELLMDAVRIRLARLPRAAFTLSGGMDSSSVLACAVRLRGTRQQAFSTVYRDPTFDESEDIKAILDATVEEWHPVQVNDPNVQDLVAEMVAATWSPVASRRRGARVGSAPRPPDLP